MRKLTVFFFLFYLTIIVANACYANRKPYIGEISICRMPNIVDLYTNKEVIIPKGTTFTDLGPLNKANGENYWNINIETLDSAVISPTDKCISKSVRAKIVSNMYNHALTVKDKRQFGAGSPIVDQADLMAIVIKDFKN